MDTPGPPPDGPGPGPGAPDSTPEPGTIRRALAECMTLADIDEVMGWRPGTARRRRWLDREAGGLPPADAELGGMPLWFRATVSRWRTGGVPTARRPYREALGGESPERAEASAENPEPVEQEFVEEEPAGEEGAGEEAPAPVRPVPVTVADEHELPLGGVDDAEVAAAHPVRSGFELAVGQPVLAHLRRGWRWAVVRAVNRNTVLVDYRLTGDPLGARRQRIGIDRIRVPG